MRGASRQSPKLPEWPVCDLTREVTAQTSTARGSGRELARQPAEPVQMLGVTDPKSDWRRPMKSLVGCAIVALALVSAVPAEAKGCLKGALVGGVAGHYTGHHGL